MTNDGQYVPTDGPVRYQYVVNRMREGATRTHAEREYTRWLAAHDARVRRDAANEAWEKCAVMAAHHGAYDGSRTRWLSSINPYTATEKENA